MADVTKMKPLPPLTGVAGLGGIFRDAARTIQEAKGAGTSLGVEAARFKEDVDTVREHVRREHEDFHFQVSTLGNGGEKLSEEQSDTTKKPATGEQQVVTGEEVGDVAPLTSDPAAAPGSGH